MKNYKIIIDAMGGDNAPECIIDGLFEAFKERDGFSAVLTGKQDILEPLLKDKGFSDRYEIVNTTEVIEMAESPVTAVRRKKDSSMVVGMQMLREKKGDAFITAGSTGAAIAGGQLVVKRIKGVERAALCPFLPTLKGRSLLIDCGANVDCRAEQLLQFAKMGDIYLKSCIGIENPTVGLINNGAEEEKGCALTKQAYTLLKDSDVNFIGNVEARDVMEGAADILVCDGFVGNVLMKSLEGTAKAIMKMLKNELMSTTRTKIGAALAKPAFKRVAKAMDYREYGGSLLIGVDGIVVKTHGSSDAFTIKNTVFQALDYLNSDVIEKLKAEISKAEDKKNEADDIRQ